MDYFKGIDFNSCGIRQNYSSVIAQTPTTYGIQYTHHGSVYVIVNNEYRYTIDTPSVFITYPGAYFEYGANSESRSHFYVCFNGPRVKKYLKSGLIDISSRNPLIPITCPDKFHSTITELIVTVEQRGPTPDRAILLLEDLLLQIHEQKGRQQLPSYHREHFIIIMEKIRKNPEINYDFHKEASRNGMHLIYYRRLFKQYSGLSPVQFVQQCRLQMAAELLLTTDNAIGSISYMCGFENHYYFSRLFKRKYNLSPVTYRRECSII